MGLITIRLVQEVKSGDTDTYRIEVLDSTNQVIASMDDWGKSKIQLEDGRIYDLKDKGIRTK